MTESRFLASAAVFVSVAILRGTGLYFTGLDPLDQPGSQADDPPAPASDTQAAKLKLASQRGRPHFEDLLHILLEINPGWLHHFDRLSRRSGHRRYPRSWNAELNGALQ
jgi:hypothetical protein